MNRRTWMTMLAACAALGWLLPGAATAQTRIDQTWPADRDVRIEINDLLVGEVKVVGWDREEMRITGEIGADVEGLDVEGSSSSWELELDWDDWDWDWDHDHDDDRDDRDERRRQRDRERRNSREQNRDVYANLEISVPRGASLEIEGVTVTIDVSDIDGHVDIETVTGTIRYRGGARQLSLGTVTGAIYVAAPEVDDLDVETVQGRIEFEGALARGARANFEAVGGSVTLRIPENTSATFDIETMQGRIANDFGFEPRRENRWVPSSELSFRLGDGSARVTIETLQGGVEIRRQ